MDTLSEVLALLKSHRTLFAGLKAGGTWAVNFPAPEGIKFNAVVEGKCWLEVEGEPVPIALSEGDCFLLTHNRPWRLSSNLARQGIDARDVYREAVGGIASLGDTVDLFLIGGLFTYGDDARLLLDGLPPVVRISARSEQAGVLRWCLERLALEYASPRLGAALMTEHLAQMMLVQILRLYQSSLGASTQGWLAALTDPRLAPVLAQVHAEPARRWTLSEMASIANQSRSTFALHFKQHVGMPPQEYLTHWRMHLAIKALNTSSSSVSSIGQALGYQSDSAFSSAFKRQMNCSPREYRERALHNSHNTHNTHSISHKEASDERYPAREDPGQRY
ncbi:AraC family transcriptional regulator [Pseudomonas sp. IB20]|uniref:AraC family transcriptional regulator n=1 Tax=Pseudomonas sp. IB20 TaxID=1702250 RepID=UPI000B9FF376|nr:AraC family transcriptional regulator [Pseudomonas sp. IB20]OZO04453.1 AraC family transcriptional regulator [Pseudomonas sp. IB20]